MLRVHLNDVVVEDGKDKLLGIVTHGEAGLGSNRSKFQWSLEPALKIEPRTC
jgi:hypothetical protein